uniref:Reverse transcriptase Ty1/copia-type domain-containing protein n=1 Tax=Physcomitrium patens TaxID=3218 RepID=A0A2K1IDW1_PHYPA|nr:hypothetical protein PHYPA_029618 [Physcomitrium patens]
MIDLNCNSGSDLKLAHNHAFYSQTKHVKVKDHSICELIVEKEITIHYIGTNNQLTDLLTKPLGRKKFLHFQDAFRMKHLSSLWTTQSLEAQSAYTILPRGRH